MLSETSWAVELNLQAFYWVAVDCFGAVLSQDAAVSGRWGVFQLWQPQQLPEASFFLASSLGSPRKAPIFVEQCDPSVCITLSIALLQPSLLLWWAECMNCWPSGGSLWTLAEYGFNLSSHLFLTPCWHNRSDSDCAVEFLCSFMLANIVCIL